MIDTVRTQLGDKYYYSFHSYDIEDFVTNIQLQLDKTEFEAMAIKFFDHFASYTYTNDFYAKYDSVNVGCALLYGSYEVCK